MITYCILLCIGGKLYPPERFPWMQCLLFGPYCKHNGHINKAEVLAIIFIANTSIPIPTIIDVICPDEDLFVIMTCVPSRPVSDMWHHITANPSALADFELDLHGWLYQLWSLVPPSAIVSNFLGGSSWQHCISACEPIGPFVDKDKLHRFLLSRVWCDEKDAIVSNAQKSF